MLGVWQPHLQHCVQQLQGGGHLTKVGPMPSKGRCLCFMTWLELMSLLPAGAARSWPPSPGTATMPAPAPLTSDCRTLCCSFLATSMRLLLKTPVTRRLIRAPWQQQSHHLQV